MASTELTLRTRAEIFSSSGCASFRNVALLVSKNASPLTVTVRIGLFWEAGTAARAAAGTTAAAEDAEEGAAAGAAAAGAGAAATGAGAGCACCGATAATGAGFAFPQPTILRSRFHCEVLTQLPYVSMTTRPSDGEPRNTSVGNWFSWATAGTLKARPITTEIQLPTEAFLGSPSDGRV